MLKVDQSIMNTDEVICENISTLSVDNRGLLSQNILSQLRNLVEYVAMKEYFQKNDVNPNDYDLRKEALKGIKGKGNLRFLTHFHELLQKSVSHYTVDKDSSERLMLKYYEFLLKIRKHLKVNYNLSILHNLSEFPLDTDTELAEYYKKISEKINCPSPKSEKMIFKDRFYIQKVKPFFVNENIYYEVTFTMAYSNTSKFDRVIAFTSHELVENYAVKFSIHTDSISMLDKDMKILIIDSYEVSIRPCEFDNFAKIFGITTKHKTTTNEYKNLMKFIAKTKMTLTDLVTSEMNFYDYTKQQITANSESSKIFLWLDKSREIILAEKPGFNVLRYCLYKMNNRIIKRQTGLESCEILSDLHLKYGCKPFDDMPFCTSLVQHNPKIYDLFNSISCEGRDSEIFARYIKNNTEIEGKLFTNINEIEGFEEINQLINQYNATLYSKHKENRKLEIYKNHIYMNGYVKDSIDIINILKSLSNSGVEQYVASVDSWLESEMHGIDDSQKVEAIRMMFSQSKVALIYGSAGTGKSTLIKHISDFWASNEKIFLANTHPAVGNLRSKVTAGKSEFYTIASFLSSKKQVFDCDVLFIDECSTVSNSDMKSILQKAKFKLLVLVGDIFQIESIYFGNWFSIVQKFVDKTSIFELEHPFRSQNNDLLLVWDRVRKLDKAILEPLVKNEYENKLDDSIFMFNDLDEIILCLNYDGLYGINNINRFIQSTNPNPEVVWGINSYKVGDPILFNESNTFFPLIHNNSKGKLVGIEADDEKITFQVELDKAINEIDALSYSFELLEVSPISGNSIISFSKNKYRSTDEDDYNDSTMIPFQVSYAISIHKAQGLEYDSVKIVITNEIEERVTHNIFYTAITRAKSNLKIFWSPETEKKVLERFENKSLNRDASILSSYANLDILT
ncbi:ATP-dependent RecD-like DNA helicase [Erysipelothrix rhusiopathiae]|nr:ATP-dependent RecD-like DNA helicase [Erysipelothrix rhusiopathiae]MDE8270836.1 ATP-dependent RecD-like DNA helicase [Erysipelothrix rhusiopathiae]MDE8278408.1 ATP-dependent RecD-like DNA helicase [Erysipelothrix rhusiopathiae]MDE8303673.1 ATP-dependent RecD-like DNA helicase [Erysipelothrix rhusiopathiae]MDE8327568.1 ATP-dependent RecD-like DNA helicase [Erysipelothrix rhusiopathiae]